MSVIFKKANVHGLCCKDQIQGTFDATNYFYVLGNGYTIFFKKPQKQIKSWSNCSANHLGNSFYFWNPITMSVKLDWWVQSIPLPCNSSFFLDSTTKNFSVLLIYIYNIYKPGRKRLAVARACLLTSLNLFRCALIAPWLSVRIVTTNDLYLPS